MHTFLKRYPYNTELVKTCTIIIEGVSIRFLVTNPKEARQTIGISIGNVSRPVILVGAMNYTLLRYVLGSTIGVKGISHVSWIVIKIV